MAEDWVSLDADWETLREKLRRGRQQMFVNMRNAIDLAGQIHENKLRDYHRAPPPSGSALVPRRSPTSPLGTVTRGLLGPLSTGREIQGTELSNLRMLRYIGRGIPYARIHEEGGEIRPRRAKVLTIPTRFHRTQAGDSRGRAIHFQGYWRRTKRGTLMFFQEGTDLPLFIGVQRVKIPPRLRFLDFWTEGEEFRRRMFVKAVALALDLKVYPPKPSRR